MLEVQQETWHRAQTHRLTSTACFCKPANQETLEKLNDPHFSIMSPTTVRGACCCSIMMIKRITALSLTPVFSTSSPAWQMIKGYDPASLFLYVLSDICCPLYFPDPFLNSTHSFNAVNEWQWAGLSAGTSWHPAWCWKNTYPHSPASDSFSGIDAEQSAAVRSFRVKVNCQ